MTTYKTTTAAQLWTKAENKAGQTRSGELVETSGLSKIIKSHQCWQLSAPAKYAGLYIEKKYLQAIEGDQPSDEPPTDEPPDNQPPDDENPTVSLIITEYKVNGDIETEEFVRLNR